MADKVINAMLLASILFLVALAASREGERRAIYDRRIYRPVPLPMPLPTAAPTEWPVIRGHDDPEDF